MKQSDQERLLNEILADDELSAVRQASLESSLTALRRRRTRRSALSRCAVVALPLLAVLAISLHWKARGPVRRPLASNHALQATTFLPREIAKAKVISDEELFALFPGRSLALIGKPGEQQLVFLDSN